VLIIQYPHDGVCRRGEACGGHGNIAESKFRGVDDHRGDGVKPRVVDEIIEANLGYDSHTILQVAVSRGGHKVLIVVVESLHIRTSLLGKNSRIAGEVIEG